LWRPVREDLWRTSPVEGPGPVGYRRRPALLPRNIAFFDPARQKDAEFANPWPAQQTAHLRAGLLVPRKLGRKLRVGMFDHTGRRKKELLLSPSATLVAIPGFLGGRPLRQRRRTTGLVETRGRAHRDESRGGPGGLVLTSGLPRAAGDTQGWGPRDHTCSGCAVVVEANGTNVGTGPQEASAF